MSNNLKNIDTKHAILLVMDYQPAIIERLDNSGQLLERTAGVIAAAREAGIRVGYVRVALNDADYSTVPATNKMFAAAAAARMMSDQDPSTAVHEAVAPAAGDIVVRKTRVGAFLTTDLHQQLYEQEIDTLILAGISTSGVVLSTVRDAADLDYQIFVLADCCADPEPSVHEFLTTQILPRQADVIEAAAFTKFAGEKGAS